MNTKLTKLISAFSGLILIGSSLHAQTLTNLAGIWNGLSFDSPAQLTQQTGPQGLVTDILESSGFGAGTFQIDVQSNGTFQDPENGTSSFSLGGQGVVNVL